jgi:putative phage-type endonuclease
VNAYPCANRTVALAEDAWLAVRRTGIGASDAPAILGQSPWVTPLQVYLEKISTAPPAMKMTKRMKLGLAFEPVMRDLYREETGNIVIPPKGKEITHHERFPILMASLDGVVLEARPPVDTSWGVLELKTSKAHEWVDGIPRHVQIQVQHQLAVTGLPWADVCLLVGNEFTIHRVGRDDKFIAWLEDYLMSWWSSHVLARVPPPIDGSEATTEAIKAAFPSDTGEIVPLRGEAAMWVKDLHQLKLHAKLTEAEIATLENRLRMEIGSASGGEIPGLGVVKLTTVPMPAQTRKAYTYRRLTLPKLKD